MSALDRALDDISSAAERLRRIGKRAGQQELQLAALLVGGLVLSLRENAVDVEEAKRIVVVVAAWGAKR